MSDWQTFWPIVLAGACVSLVLAVVWFALGLEVYMQRGPKPPHPGLW